MDNDCATYDFCSVFQLRTVYWIRVRPLNKFLVLGDILISSGVIQPVAKLRYYNPIEFNKPVSIVGSEYHNLMNRLLCSHRIQLQNVSAAFYGHDQVAVQKHLVLIFFYCYYCATIWSNIQVTNIPYPLFIKSRPLPNNALPLCMFVRLPVEEK